MSFKKNMKIYGFQTYDDQVKQLFQQSLENFVQKSSSQSGGRVTMPSEYFGVSSGAYSADGSGSSQAPTQEWARPGIEFHDISGGAMKYKVSKKAFADACKKYNPKITKARQAELKAEYEEKLHNLLKKLSKKKDTHLSKEAVTTVFKQRNYQKVSP